MIETHRSMVRPHHLDHMGHMNVQWYTAKFDDATWHLFAAGGLTSEYFQTENRGMAALEQNTRYLAEAMAGDLVLCRSKVLSVDNKVLKFVHHMHNAVSDQLIATTELAAAHLDRDLRKACPFPDQVRQKYAELGWPESQA